MFKPKKDFSSNALNKAFRSPVFWNFPLDKGRLKNFVSWFLKNHGEKKTLDLLENLKTFGFGYATKAGVSLGIEDLKIPPKKIALIAQAEFKLSKALIAYRKGNITGIEKTQHFIQTWHETSETLKQEVVRHFEKTDILNPVYMMAFSGARGNLSQVRQLVGMRGLMADPQGKIIDFPIQSNFREGLTLTEYLISTYGARKGIVDTALRTATAGYLTRRLVDVAQHVIVSKFDCGTRRGIFLFDMKEGVQTIYSFQNRLTGRVLAQDISIGEEGQKNVKETVQKHSWKVGFRNQEVTVELASAISKITKKALVRSPLTCETRKFVCQLCYGWSLATSRLVSIGEAVGVIAGQSIGEPGTQLTMRTFHTGGVFAGNITEQIDAPFAGFIEYPEPISGTFIRTPQGSFVFLTKTHGTMFLKQFQSEISEKFDEIKTPVRMNAYKIPAFTVLFARHGQFIEKDTLLAQISALPTGQKSTQTIEQTIYSGFEGEVYYDQIDLLEDIDEKYGDRVSKAEDWSKVWVLAAKIFKDPLNASFFAIRGDLVAKTSVLNQIQWATHFAQFFYLNENAAYSKSLLKSEAFRTAVRNRMENVSTPEYSYRIKNAKRSRVEASPKFFSTSKLSFDPTCSVERTKNLKILPKYNVKRKFLVASDVLGRTSELLCTSNAKNNEGSKGRGTKNTKPVKTLFIYPYISNLRSKFLKIISQTFISLPILRPGQFHRLFDRSEKSQDLSSEMTNVKNRFSGLNHRAERKRFVKKLNMNKKFRFYELEKTNLFHPLFLSNLLPFAVPTKTLKPYLKRTERRLIFNEQNQSVLNMIDRSYESQKFFQEIFCRSLYRRFRFSDDGAGKIDKNVSTHFRDTLFYQNIYKNKKPSSFNVKSIENQKLEKIAIKTPMLFFVPKTIRYKKVGYFVSKSIRSDEFDEFFSFLPLKGESFIDSNKRDLLAQPSLKSNRESETFVSKTPRSNFSGDKNTYQWNPMPTDGCSWFPSFSQTKSNGIFEMSAPMVWKTILPKKVFKQKTKTSTHLNNLTVETAKRLCFVNVAQSQNLKKHRRKFVKPFILSKPEKSFFEFRRFANEMHCFFVKKKTKATISARFCVETLTKKTRNVRVFRKDRPSEKNHSFSLEKYSSSFERRRFSSPKKKEKNPKALAIFLKKFSFQTLRIDFFDVKKHPMKLFDRAKQPDLEKSFDVRSLVFAKKYGRPFKQLETLMLKIHFSQKSSVFFHAVDWLPQENYVFDAFCSISKNQTTQTFQFTSKNKPAFWGENAFKFSLVNAQGLKKSLLFQQDGFFKIKFLKNVQACKTITQKQFSVPTNKPRFLFDENFTVSLERLSKNLGEADKPSRSNSFEPTLTTVFDASSFQSSLRSKFLKYLKSRKNFTVSSEQAIKDTKMHFVDDLSFCSALATSVNISKIAKKGSFFTFLPFRHQNKNIKKFETPKKLHLEYFPSHKKKMSQVQVKKISLTLKPGWIYKTSNVSNVLKFDKTWIEPGRLVFDEISFDQQKVLVERISFSEKNTVKKNDFSIRFSEKSRVYDFKTSSTVKNLQLRFSNVEKPVMHQAKYLKNASVVWCEKNPQEPTAAQNPTFFFFLIRPVHNRILPNIHHMKTNLYKSTLKQSNKKSSYFSYTNYFSNELNLQKIPLKTVSNFPPFDLKIDRSQCLPLLDAFKTRPRKKKLVNEKAKEKMLSRKKENSVQRNRVVSTLLFSERRFHKNLKPKLVEKRSLSTDVSKNKLLKSSRVGVQSKTDQLSMNSKKLMYFSNHSLNLFPLKVSINNHQNRSLTYSCSNIALNTLKTNDALLKNFSKKHPFKSALKIEYLNVLLVRNTQKSCDETIVSKLLLTPSLRSRNEMKRRRLVSLNLNLNPVKSEAFQKVGGLIPSTPPKSKVSADSPLSVEKNPFVFQFRKITSLKSFLSVLNDLPFFEYSLQQNYAFLANQRLFASYFYKRQFQNLFEVSSFSERKFHEESFRNKRFLEKSSTSSFFSDCFRNKPVSKNHFLLNRQNFDKSLPFGLTSFYSPFEGEILKLNDERKNAENLQKTLNIHLENTFLTERKTKKLVLTKADIFCIKFPSKPTRFVDFGESFLELDAQKKAPKENFLSVFFDKNVRTERLKSLVDFHGDFQNFEKNDCDRLNSNKYQIPEFTTNYKNKRYKLKSFEFEVARQIQKLRLGQFIQPGEKFYSNTTFLKSGQIIHLNGKKLTLRKAQFFSVSPKAILHASNGDCLTENAPVITLPFQTLKTGDIVQGIPKVEQYLEARTTIQGRLFLNSLPVLLYAIYQRYSLRLNMEQAVRQSFLKIQQILVDGVQRVYRSQGVSIADKHLEIIVRQMTSKVKIIHGGQTGFFPGELVDLEFVERVNRFLMVKIRYEPLVLGITKASLEVDSFLSAASFQQTTKILTRSALENKRDFLKGLKENLLVGNLLPAGTGYVVPMATKNPVGKIQF